MPKGVYEHKPHSSETRLKMSLSHVGINNWSEGNRNAYKSGGVGYQGIHAWVRKMLGRPSLCEDCGTTVAKRFEWANISGQYLRDLSDWKRLCPKCHHKMDNITAKGWETRRSK